jgi:hypothetical protein
MHKILSEGRQAHKNIQLVLPLLNFRSRQNQAMMLEVRIAVTSVGVFSEKGQRNVCADGNALLLNLCAE